MSPINTPTGSVQRSIVPITPKLKKIQTQAPKSTNTCTDCTEASNAFGSAFGVKNKRYSDLNKIIFAACEANGSYVTLYYIVYV